MVIVQKICYIQRKRIFKYHGRFKESLSNVRRIEVLIRMEDKALFKSLYKTTYICRPYFNTIFIDCLIQANTNTKSNRAHTKAIPITIPIGTQTYTRSCIVLLRTLPGTPPFQSNVRF